ncbi:MAG: hypothetical protein AABZ47_13670 [Planctomycetota bacterium]
MTKLMTDRQRSANRKNARRSTGPKTQSGKRRSSRNALRHGLLAKAVVLQSSNSQETRADFDALIKDFIHELRPQNVLEETLVERIATCYWRLRRAQRFEVGSIRDLVESPDENSVDLESLRKELHQSLLVLEFDERFQLILTKPSDRLTPDEAREKQEYFDEFDNKPMVAELHPDSTQRRNHARWVHAAQLGRDRAKVESLRDQIQHAQENSALRDWRKSLHAFLPADDDLTNVIRYESMIDRQMHRALLQLHRLREVTRHDTSKTKK